MIKIKQLWHQYASVISYLVFGVLTTLVNIGVFDILDTHAHWNYQVATVIAWFVSVLFAYITNKLWVFDSKTTTSQAFLTELGSFFFFRIVSLFMDMGMMWLGISVLHASPLLTKVIDNVVIVVVNYLFSKVFIFRKQATQEEN
ncbi:teichoic acid glycosylation protein [Secundilactobacillus paracollinoides]|uniref:Teichoic acid glycosylation protein n=1 Tax=Secundilactobacillus paracollinoides TaxID=240427 RepID=A0A1B2IX78_9LACO|nr:GtrA family protein [Secundilactobacillus paracollinoides]ANZ60835.1 teichoic acid glycosylation protein [Secundilactobacillus paracollinoides]ANZ65222.1 teichoic acid glycosylation protein [Secundilactobacillus paracollinoides]ANZ66694.1 teichoic acid glycosylation protein [Secundilactobacillus paracollinoides]